MEANTHIHRYLQYTEYLHLIVTGIMIRELPQIYEIIFHQIDFHKYLKRTITFVWTPSALLSTLSSTGHNSFVRVL